LNWCITSEIVTSNKLSNASQFKPNTMSAISSFCIPRMDTRSLPGSIEEIKTFVATQFTNILTVDPENIDIVPKYTDQGYLYYTAFIHPTASDALYHNIVADIERLEKVKIHFSDKWFWIMRMSTATRPRDFEILYEEIEEAYQWFMDQLAHDEMVLFQTEYFEAGPTLEDLIKKEDDRVTRSFDWSTADDDASSAVPVN
jgi:hypothetical protein